MYCQVISPDANQKFDNVKSVTFTSETGEMEILPGHAESFVKLGEGETKIITDQENSIITTGGFCHINDDRVVIIL